MAAACLLEHVVVEPARVVWAQQRPGRSLVEGEVEQRLVRLAFDDLGTRPPGPDRLADTADRPAVAAVVGHERAPGGNDPRRVAPQPLHVDEPDRGRVGPEHALDQAALRRAHGDEHGLVAVHPLA
jgi:hypothetical protein